jgi:hypothetical protein
MLLKCCSGALPPAQTDDVAHPTQTATNPPPVSAPQAPSGPPGASLDTLVTEGAQAAWRIDHPPAVDRKQDRQIGRLLTKTQRQINRLETQNQKHLAAQRDSLSRENIAHTPADEADLEAELDALMRDDTAPATQR